MKPSRRNLANAKAKAEKRQGRTPALSKYAAKLAKPAMTGQHHVVGERDQRP